jgi:hypothetical protein
MHEDAGALRDPRHFGNASLMRVRLLTLSLLFAAGCASADVLAPARTVTDPARAQIVTSDLTRFWAAYDGGGKVGSKSAFQRGYLDRASPGLKQYMSAASLTAASITQMIAVFPNYFASIRANRRALATDDVILARIRSNYGVIKSLYPPAVFPPLTLLVGRFSTGGTTLPSGMLIGAEFYSSSTETPLDELGQFQRDNVKVMDSIPIVVAHEHAHILQEHAGGIFQHTNRTLLEQALLEGGADFVGEVSSGSNGNKRLWSFGIPNEAALWAEFQRSMHGRDYRRWLYNQVTATSDRPGDLGYFIGYRIVEAFYLKQSDKAAALRDIIEIRDADDFLARSAYAP